MRTLSLAASHKASYVKRIIAPIPNHFDYHISRHYVSTPCRSLEQADELLLASTKRLAESFVGERQTLERQGMRGENVSTDDLRLALRRYRSFFGRLLSVYGKASARAPFNFNLLQFRCSRNNSRAMRARF
jgi:hypothetical protein